MTSDKRQTPPALDQVCHPTGSVAVATRWDHPSLWGSQTQTLDQIKLRGTIQKTTKASLLCASIIEDKVVSQRSASPLDLWTIVRCHLRLSITAPPLRRPGCLFLYVPPTGNVSAAPSSPLRAADLTGLFAMYCANLAPRPVFIKEATCGLTALMDASGTAVGQLGVRLPSRHIGKISVLSEELHLFLKSNNRALCF